MYFNEIWGNCEQISDKAVHRILFFFMCHIVKEPVNMEDECILGEILRRGLSRSLCGHHFILQLFVLISGLYCLHEAGLLQREHMFPFL